MANVTLKAPSSIAAGQQFFDRDGGSHTIAAGGLLTIDTKYANDCIAQGFSVPNAFQPLNANVTAQASANQANATALAYGLNQVATVATAGDGVALPAAVPGESCTIQNDDADPIVVFGTNGTSDTINGVAGATGIRQAGSSIVRYYCAVAGQWKAIPGTGYSGEVATFGPAVNGVASNGTTQGNGTPITARTSRVTTVGSVNGAVTLPAAVPGDVRIVTNANAANAANVYPAVNEFINGLAANAGLNLASNKSVLLSCGAAGHWDGILTA